MSAPAAHSLTHKSWFLWPTLLAAILEFVGVITHVYHSFINPTDHFMFLLSYSCMLAAPALLAIANFNVFNRMLSWMLASDIRGQHPVWKHAQTLVSLFPTLGLTPIVLFGLGVSDLRHFLSARPIQGIEAALERVLYYERGTHMLFIGHIVSVVCLSMFAIMTAVILTNSPTRRSAQDFEVPEKQKTIFWGVNTINSLCWIRSVAKIVELSLVKTRGTDLAHSETLLWILDIGPVLAALVMFCIVQPGQYLPEQYTHVLLGDEKEHAGHDERMIANA